MSAKATTRKGHPVWLQAVTGPACFTLLLIFLWQGLGSQYAVPTYILPAPFDVALTLARTARLFAAEALITSLEAVAGFVVGSSLGFFTAVIFVHSRPLEQAIYPYAIAFKTIPLVAVSPLLTLWFGTGFLSKVVMASLLCYFPVLVNTTAGLRSVDDLSLAYFRSIAASKVQMFWRLRLPSSLPYLFSALRISVTMSMVGATVAELTGADRGLGYQILAASYRLETEKLFASIVWLGVVGVVFFCLVAGSEKILVPWSRRRD